MTPHKLMRQVAKSIDSKESFFICYAILRTLINQGWSAFQAELIKDDFARAFEPNEDEIDPRYSGWFTSSSERVLFALFVAELMRYSKQRIVPESRPFSDFLSDTNVSATKTINQ